ncbi:hypothetical protein CALCODRAFT_356753 [Calocera cornea HHB12733]|uniref:Uncharacterized protein n=1 Tax=Calocera cornea HHB12733 TaxID=1353952 RepID=A0A165ENW2_9BASI|nr:hypothetical protein CALCODRAFT_356753 [Calocera cornea HHB12733]
MRGCALARSLLAPPSFRSAPSRSRSSHSAHLHSGLILSSPSAKQSISNTRHLAPTGQATQQPPQHTHLHNVEQGLLRRRPPIRPPVRCSAPGRACLSRLIYVGISGSCLVSVQGYYPPQGGPPPGQGYYPPPPQQAYQPGGGPRTSFPSPPVQLHKLTQPRLIPSRPEYYPQQQPVYQQPPPQQSGGGMAEGTCMACLAGACLCCCAEGASPPSSLILSMHAHTIMDGRHVQPLLLSPRLRTGRVVSSTSILLPSIRTLPALAPALCTLTRYDPTPSSELVPYDKSRKAPPTSRRVPVSPLLLTYSNRALLPHKLLNLLNIGPHAHSGNDRCLAKPGSASKEKQPTLHARGGGLSQGPPQAVGEEWLGTLPVPKIARPPSGLSFSQHTRGRPRTTCKRCALW